MTNHLIKFKFLALVLGLGAISLTAVSTFAAEAISTESWFQVEVTVFTNEDGSAETELWSPNKLSLTFPERLRTLKKLSDVLQLSDWTLINGPLDIIAVTAPVPERLGQPLPISTELDAVSELTVAPVVIGPLPYAPGSSFKLPDFAREAFLALPAEDYDFVSTNRALTQSADHRILYHNAWRQPVTRRNSATAIAVTGGREFTDRFELEGSLTLYFNNAGDRVILSPNLWLTSFSTADTATEEWQLPALPRILQPTKDAVPTPLQNSVNEAPVQEYFVSRIIQFNQTREMRSDEFHYLDHPAMGVLIQITPYTVPLMPVPEIEADIELSDPALPQDGI